MTALLEVRALTCRFGGVVAVNAVSFSVEKGCVYSVIGPNGAGKTTLFNLVSGIYAPTDGDVLLRGKSIRGQEPESLAKLGMSRTFQNLQVCMNMGALENVMVGAHLRMNTGFLSGMLQFPRLRQAVEECRAEAIGWMAFSGVKRYVGVSASRMPYGAMKRLEIARALTAHPELLLLDEPAAGLNPTETREIEALVRKVADSGITVMLVEHDMKMVMNVSDRILVMHHGARLAEGSPAQIREHPEVIAAYLGTGMEHAA